MNVGTSRVRPSDVPLRAELFERVSALVAIGSEEAEASVCPQNRAYGSVHGSSRKTYPLRDISVNRSCPFISLALCRNRSSIARVRFAACLRLRYSPAPFPADLQSLVFNQRSCPLTCSALHLRPPVAGLMFYPQLCHHSLIGIRLYDYYGFICRPPLHHRHVTALLRA